MMLIPGHPTSNNRDKMTPSLVSTSRSGRGKAKQTNRVVFLAPRKSGHLHLQSRLDLKNSPLCSYELHQSAHSQVLYTATRTEIYQYQIGNYQIHGVHDDCLPSSSYDCQQWLRRMPSLRSPSLYTHRVPHPCLVVEADEVAISEHLQC